MTMAKRLKRETEKLAKQAHIEELIARTKKIDITTVSAYGYFAKRIEDKTLLQQAVPIIISAGAAVGLAVPVGGTRRGGYAPFKTINSCHLAVKQLKDRPGFPNLRIVPSDDGFNVWWGEPEPSGDAIEHGRYFGYSEAAINEYKEKIKQMFLAMRTESFTDDRYYRNPNSAPEPPKETPRKAIRVRAADELETMEVGAE